VQKKPLGPRDGHRPAQLPQTGFERIRFVEELHDLELASVAEAARGQEILGGCAAAPRQCFRDFVPKRVEEENSTVLTQAGLHETPKPVEPLRRNVREPKAEEDYIVEAIRCPLEQIRPRGGARAESSCAAG